MRRPRVRYSELTSLLDVLFIVVFAALVQASGLVDRARHAPRPAPARPRARPVRRPTTPAPKAHVAAPAAPGSTQRLRQRAAQTLVAASARAGVVRVQVTAGGRIQGLTVTEAGQTRTLTLDVPLLERVPDPNVGVAYLGHRSAALRVCTAVRRALGWPTLRDALVIIEPARPLATLQVALVEGLRADQHRCYGDERGLAVILDPEPPPGARARPAPTP